MAKHTLKKRKGPRFSPQFIKRLSSWLVLSTALTLAVRSATNLYWDSDQSGAGNVTDGTNLGGTGTWDNTTTSNWWDGAAVEGTWQGLGGGSNAIATFAGSVGTVTVGEAVSTAGLSFNSAGFTLTGTNAITITAPTAGTATSLAGVGVNVVTGVTAAGPGGTGNNTAITTNGAPVILGNSQNWNVGNYFTYGYLKQTGTISDTGNNAGLGKTGRGTLWLNGGNTFGGQVAVRDGVLVITSPDSLGTGTSLLQVYGDQFLGGGELMLASGGLPGFTLTRDLALAGVGQAVAIGSQAAPQTFLFSQGALANVGFNTVKGNITLSTAVTTRIVSNFGNLTLTGGNITLAAQTEQFGTSSGNSAQPNNIIISSLITGGAAGNTLQKFGQGTLWLQNAGNNFLNNVQIDTGFVRVDTGSELGASTTTSAVNLNGGTLEVRTDVGSGFAGKNVNFNTNSTIFASRAVGGVGINQNVTFGGLNSTTSNITWTFTGRDGYGITLGTGGTTAMATGNPINISSSLNGLLTINGSLSQADTTFRTYTITNAGDMLITGNLLNTSASQTNDHNWIKANVGMLAIQGTASTEVGVFSLTNGTVAINGMNALNATLSGGVQIGSGSFGHLEYLGASGTGVGETSTKAIINSVSTANFYAAIYGNQQQDATHTGATALTLSSNIASIGAVNKNFYLGGDNNTGLASVVNTINGVIEDNATGSVTSLIKGGTGTWLYAPSASNYVLAAQTGRTVTSGGAANTNKFVVNDASGLVVGQTVTGTNIPANSVITAISGTTIYINNNISTAITASTALTFGTVGLAGAAGQSFSGAVTISGGTLQVQPTANSGAGSAPLNATAGATTTNNLVFAVDSLQGNQSAGGTFQLLGSAAAAALTTNVGQLQLSAGAATIVTTANGGTPTLNFVNTTPITRTAGAVVNFKPGTGTGGILFATTPTLLNGIIGTGTGLGFAYYTSPTGNVDFATYSINGTNGATVTGVGAFGGAGTGTAYNNALPATGSSATTTYLIDGTSAVVSAAETVNALKLNGNASLSLSGALTLGAAGQPGGVLFDNSTGSATISSTGAANTLGAAGQEVIVTVAGNTPANTLTISAPISGTTGALTKAGSGVLVISGANTFTGNVVVDEGTLRLSGATANLLGPITTAGNTTIVRQGATLDLNGAGVGGVTMTGALVGAGVVTNSGGGTGAPSTLVIGNAAVTTVAGAVFSGLLQDGAGVLNVTKFGTGVQYLDPLNGATVSTTPTGQTLGTLGVNTYSGVTTIALGTLSVTTLADYGKASGIGTGSAQSNVSALVLGSSAGTGILQYIGQNQNNFLQLVQSPSVTTNRLFTLAGNGTLDSSGGQAGAGVNTGNANNAVVWFNNTGALGFGTNGAKTLTLQGNSQGDNEIDIQLINNTLDSSALSVTKTGSGLWILGSSNNTYSGNTLISQGILGLKDGTSLSPNSNLIFGGSSTNNTVLEMSGTFTRTIGAATGGVSWNTNANGGFSAGSSKLTVNFGGAGAQVAWGTGGIGNGTGNLILSSPTSLAEVEIVNGIDLGTGYATTRTIQVDDNSTTTTDFATISGNIIGSVNSGVAALTKTGGGVLVLSGHNSFLGGGTATVNTGGVVVSAGTVAINSFANGGSLGALDNLNLLRDRLVLGTNAAGTTGVALTYMGSGEVVTRMIEIGGTTGTSTIESSGSGPIIIQNMMFTQSSGTKTLNLRGDNADRNEITAVLQDNGANKLALTKNDSGVWTLSGANTYTGGTTVSSGVIIANNAAAFGTAGVTYGNAALQAAQDLVFTNAFTINNANMDTSGLFSMTFGSLLNTGGNSVLNNYVGQGGTGKTLTVTGAVNLQDGTNPRTFNLNGTGTTILNGAIVNGGTATGSLSVSMSAISNAGPGTLQINGSTANTYTGTTTLSNGIIQIGKGGSLTPFGTGGLTVNGNIFLQSTVDLTGTDKIQNNVTFSANPANWLIQGANSIEFGGTFANSTNNNVIWNFLPSAKSLKFDGAFSLQDGTNARTFTINGPGNTIIAGVVQNGGTSTGNLVKSGAGTLTLTGGATYTGTTTINDGVLLSNTFGTGTGALNAVSTGALVLGGGTLSIVRSDANNGTQTVGAVTLTANTSSHVAVNSGSNTGPRRRSRSPLRSRTARPGTRSCAPARASRQSPA